MKVESSSLLDHKRLHHTIGLQVALTKFTPLVLRFQLRGRGDECRNGGNPEATPLGADRFRAGLTADSRAHFIRRSHEWPAFPSGAEAQVMRLVAARLNRLRKKSPFDAQPLKGPLIWKNLRYR